MLETTLSTAFVPATNLQGRVAGANWSYLLPSLELERVLCVGSPSAAALAALARLARAVTVVCASSRQAAQVGKTIRDNRWANVQAAADGEGPASLPPGAVDLAVVAGWNSVRRLRRDGRLLAHIQHLLKPDGMIYCEFGGLALGPIGGRATKDRLEGFERLRLFWLAPLRGEARAAVPLGDRATIGYFLGHVLKGLSVNLRGWRRLVGLSARFAFLGRFIRRCGVLAGGEPTEQPPHYLRAVAARAGVDISRHRWGLTAHGRYNSQKVLFLLFDRAGVRPEYVVKMTRDPRFNSRLENEFRALSLLRRLGLDDGQRAPQPAFFGHHGSLAILGETAIEGAPFRRRGSAQADSPHLRDAVGWLTDLAAATASLTQATPSQAARGLERLCDQFVHIYHPSPAHRDFLRAQVQAVASCPGPLPLVFQHGDPGAWNLLVTPSGRVAFLDWEAAEPAGMPLWDLFYLLRSCGVSAARRGGAASTLKVFEARFLAESAFSALLAESVRRYCARIGLPPDLIEPLFYTCWMHRALKEATRLPTDRLEKGQYAALLRLCIERRDAPGLRRLFG